MTYLSAYSSPLGAITLASDGECLIGLWFDGQQYDRQAVPENAVFREVPPFAETRRWLDAYFAGQQPDYLPPLRLTGSPFRQMVGEIMLGIPYGTTTTYAAIASEVAHRKNRPSMSAQAVGQAVGHNPIGVIVPCHRVLGSAGQLTGYAGGLDRKFHLLRHEGALLL